jgi:hypothetical protein
VSEEKIASALGLRPLSEVREDEIIIEQPTMPVKQEIILPSTGKEEDETVKDIEFARKNVTAIISSGADALENMLSLAKQSESARAYEVAATIMKTLLDANKDLVDISMKKKFEKEEQPASQTNVTNNNLVISTTDLLQMLKGENK